MKNPRNRAKTAAAITMVLLMASVMLMANVANVSVLAEVGVSGPVPAGKTPDVTVPTTAHLSFEPSLVGLGQSILINMWVSPGLDGTRFNKDYTLTITKPDGTKDVKVMDSENGTGATWLEYAVDQVGTWKLKFDFKGMYFPGAYAPSFFGPPVWMGSAYYEPASTAEQELVVQQEMVYSWPPAPIPTDYWTRPVDFALREWWPILGNWPATGYDGETDPEWNTRYPNTNPYWSNEYDFTPWVQAPNSAHIVWKRQGAIAGLIGGQTGSGTGITVSGGGPSIVYAGRAYQTVTKAGGATVLQCYDIRTGEVYWEQPLSTTVTEFNFGGIIYRFTTTLAPTLLEYDTGMAQAGSYGEGSITHSVNLMTISDRLYKWDPWTGAMTTNVSRPVTGTYYKNQYVLGVQDLGPAAGALRYRLINWTTDTTASYFGGPAPSMIISNTTYARSSLPSWIDWNVGLGATVDTVSKSGAYVQINVTGYNLATGAKLWSNLVDEPAYSTYGCVIADDGKIATLSINGYWLAWDLYSGKLAWKSEKMDYPWDSSGFGGYMSASAYGMFFRTAYSGVYAFNWTNGKIVWKYEHKADAAFESPYVDVNGTDVYSDNTGVEIADGKLYSYNCEHSQTWPRTRGWSTFCIDVFTGKEKWSMQVAGTSAFGDLTDISAIADGYLSLSSADGYQYVFGKGKSATTVTAPDTAVPLGTALLIRGTVLDQSPAQPGTPCVSKDSMSLQMEYLHLQHSIGGLWGNETINGVPVTLTAIGSDGTVTDIGKVTTEGYFGTFSKAWTPTKEDTYKIVASFAGDDSYGSSGAATAVTVGPAPATPTPTPTPPEAAPDNTPMYILGATIAIILAVAIVGMLILRKRP